MQQGKLREKGGKVEEEKTVAIFGSQNTNMGRKKQQRGNGGTGPATAMQLALVREVVGFWEDPITEERENWTAACHGTGQVGIVSR